MKPKIKNTIKIKYGNLNVKTSKNKDNNKDKNKNKIC